MLGLRRNQDPASHIPITLLCMLILPPYPQYEVHYPQYTLNDHHGVPEHAQVPDSQGNSTILAAL